MRNLIEKYLPLYSPDGGGGDGADVGADKGGENESAGAADGAAGDKAGAEDVVGSSSASGELYRPKGLPDTMFGETDNETMDKMADTIQGFRKKIDNLPKAPKEISGYEMGEVPEELKEYFDNLKDDPIYDGMRVLALKHGLTTDQFKGFMTDNISEWVDAGLMSGMVNQSDERAALLTKEASWLPGNEQADAINSRMQDNIDWMEKVGPQHGFSAELGEFLIEQLGDRAKGHFAIEAIRKLASGPQPLDLGGGGEGQGALAKLEAREADPRNNPGNTQYNKAYAEETVKMWQTYKPA